MTTNLDTAVGATGSDAGVPWHYGDPLREQRVLRTGAAVVDRSNRDVLVVSGVDRLGWLHSICSQHLTALADGDATEALVLSPNGHVEQHWQLAELGEQVWIDTEPGTAADSLAYLQKMVFLKRVEPVDVSAQWAVVSLVGPAADTVLAVGGLPVPEAGRAVTLPDGGFVRRALPTASGVPGTVDLVVPRDRRVAVIDALVEGGAGVAGLWAYEALRVEARVARFGRETDHRTIPHEVGWIGRAVHLDKGCYRGQETVARVHNLGRPPRRLVLVHLAGESDELPEPGTPVTVAEGAGAAGAGRPVGFVGTAVHHHELGPIALAVIKRALPDETPLAIGGHIAAIDPDPAA
ncbi:folate-binding protein YgfZ [Jatrophihabitans endophyticus]|uniref:CAF17-like 4Fe-4S cluster assembly/insertion protein YgfZ n=1 Tax=Jatrophihabitans endophyticus TaxID=1206085 RepID=UPI001A0D1E99|nr:folate-binding protein [Jatrophihabitans endophyticus]MBE7188884.1 folate-binding protein YgfZ [Jatrophihabitans endophyticus]